MDAIRNYVQHRSLPVGPLTYRLGATMPMARSAVRFGHRATTRSGRFGEAIQSSSVAFWAEIGADASARDLTLMIRQFVAGLGRVHLTVRDLTAQDVEAWKTTFACAVEKARGASSIQSDSWPSVDEEGEYRDKVHLVEHTLKRCQEMRKRYRNLDHLERCYVSGRIGPRRKPRRPRSLRSGGAVLGLLSWLRSNQPR